MTETTQPNPAAPSPQQAVAEPLLPWKFNHARKSERSDDSDGLWEIGFLDDDDLFSPIITVDTGLYFQAEQAEPLAKAILAALAPQAVSEPPAGVAVALRSLRDEAMEIFDGPETPQGERDVIEWFAASINVIIDRAWKQFEADIRSAGVDAVANPTHQAAEPAPSEFDPSLGKASEAKGEPQTSLTAPAAAPLQVAQQAHPDTVRLDWLERQGKAYGFEDVHEGNVWEIGGAYHSIREAIDHESRAEVMSIPAPKSDALTPPVDQLGGQST